jgi:hypothetical protein
MSLRRCNFGSGIVVGLGMVSGAVGMVALGRTVGWDQAWRALGVTPLQPPFFDMHVIDDSRLARGKEPMRMRHMRATQTTSISCRPGCGWAFSVSMAWARSGFQRQ